MGGVDVLAEEDPNGDLATWAVLQKAVKEVLQSLSPGSTMVAADIGCSSGPNTLLLVSEVMNTISDRVRETADNSPVKEVQFFLNDLPGNDFNLVFRSLEQLHSLATVAAPCYIAGLPGSITLSDGRMVLTFVGRKREEMPMHGGVARVWEVLSEVLQYLVQKGRVEKKKLSSFNMPYYAPSLDEVTQLIKRNGLFDIQDISFFESNWDAHDDSDGDVVLDCSSSAENIAKTIRAGIEPLILKQFGEDILDELFMVYTSILAKNLEKGKAMCPAIVVNLKKSKRPLPENMTTSVPV
ncbi:hypothetical protein BS78_05G139800 [Paspalum vaginatum]|nr:hypothetical protein BS78_05G139800 [Paspalum vaginatum]